MENKNIVNTDKDFEKEFMSNLMEALKMHIKEERKQKRIEKANLANKEIKISEVR